MEKRRGHSCLLMGDRTDKLRKKYSTIINTLEGFNRCTWTYWIQKARREVTESLSCLVKVFQPFLRIAKFDSLKVYLSGISWCCNPSLKILAQQLSFKGLDQLSFSHQVWQTNSTPFTHWCHWSDLRRHFIMVVCIVVQNGFWTCQAAFCCRVSAVWGTLDWFILCVTELLSDSAGTSHQEWEMESTATRDSLTEQNVVCQPSITTKSESYSYDIISHVPDFIYVTQRDEGQSEHIIQLQHTMLLLIHQLYKKLYFYVFIITLQNWMQLFWESIIWFSHF